MRDQIIALLQQGKTHRAIAAELGCARSTVSHHADSLKNPKKAPNRTRPMKDEILRLLGAGKSYDEIVEATGCSKATISYHAKRHSFKESRRDIYDWDAIQAFHDDGHGLRECARRFGFSTASWYWAVKTGKLIERREHFWQKLDLSEILTENSAFTRVHLKKRLINEGILTNECSECGQGPVWCGKPLILVLDHRNGVYNDNRQENLRLLCPNCNSQTETFAGRNRRYKK